MPYRADHLVRHATLRQLQVFVAIAREGSFSKAAERLHLTQPTVSMQVKKLSEAVGEPLFEQIGRKVYLTEVGRIMLEAAESILDQLALAEERVNELRGVAGGTVRLSVVSTAQYFVPEVIHAFLEEYPDVNVVMEVGNRETLLARIQQNVDDFYILGQPPEGLRVESHLLANNPLAVVAHRDNPLAQTKKRIRLEALAEAPFLMREKGSGIRKQVEHVFREHGFEPNVKMVLGGNEAIRLGLRENLGVTVASLPTLIDEIESGEIVVLDVQGFPVMRHWYLAWPEGKAISLASRLLIERMQLAAAGLDEQIGRLLKHSG
ncbi:DNA-binding transcriptional regulator, LysR family [Sulfurivirga caldicuralii]|uniref:DNA-binding transcriptional regulator, LysR family n=1 Tax=Sulfurivirga caldicuralii TaxID=364032 RepID=A0A1N6DK05_9GAMM|nr:LysR family transcriptional regulator [Sulfurivirga caldicuralii]SIN71003.1 DNA-binding transcriptional regulator, LysR family [Sulfurivirga caldicuralii]